MKRAIVLQHVPFEGPAKIGLSLIERGYGLDVRRLDLGDRVPTELSPGDLLIVMGGPMGVGDVEHREYPFLREELRLLQQCVAQEAPVLGICLGAQLLAAAAGAVVYPMLAADGARYLEVGWAPIQLDSGGTDEPVLRGLPAEFVVLHWHGDTFDLPPRARLLASTSRCKNQAFQLGPRAFGLQFHCEVEAEQVEEFLRADEEFVRRANGPEGPERTRRDTERLLVPARATGDLLLGNILDLMMLPG